MCHTKKETMPRRRSRQVRTYPNYSTEDLAEDGYIVFRVPEAVKSEWEGEWVEQDSPSFRLTTVVKVDQETYDFIGSWRRDLGKHFTLTVFNFFHTPAGGKCHINGIDDANYAVEVYFDEIETFQKWAEVMKAYISEQEVINGEAMLAYGKAEAEKLNATKIYFDYN